MYTIKKGQWICFAMFFAISTISPAQQVQDYNLYSQNLYLINSAFAGYQQSAAAFFHTRTAHRGLDSSPRNYTVGASAPIEAYNIGLGGKFNIDQRGIFQTFSAEFAVAYKLAYKYKHIFSFGMDMGFVNRSINLDALNDRVNKDDPALTSDYFNSTRFKSGVGASYVSPTAEVGLALPMLVESGEEINTHVVAYGGYKFTKVDNWLFKPSLYFRTILDGTYQGDVNFLAEWKKTVWIQPGLRSNLTALLSTGFSFNYGSVGYSFNVYTGAYSKNMDFNWHELYLVLNLGGNSGKLAFVNSEKAGKQLQRRRRR